MSHRSRGGLRSFVPDGTGEKVGVLLFSVFPQPIACKESVWELDRVALAARLL